jgi:hypothetical protein
VPTRNDDRSAADDLAAIAGDSADPGSPATRREWAARLAGVARSIAATARATARTSGTRGLARGRIMVDVLIDTTPRIPVRTRAALLAQFPGLTDDEIAAHLVTAGARATAAIGAAAGALSAVEFAAPPTLLAAPVQVAAETVAVAATEIRLLAELHELYQAPVPGPIGDRSIAYLLAWAEQRRVAGPRGAPAAVRDAAIRRVRSRLVRQLGRNSSSLAPMFVGALAGSQLNRRGTHALGERLIRDLRRGRSHGSASR